MPQPNTIEEIATRPAVVCDPTATLSRVATLMRDREVGCVIVVDEHSRPIGICTDRDLVVRALADRWPPATPVAAVMTEGVLGLEKGSPIAEAGPIMERKGIRRVPVLDDLGRVLGVASLDDVVRALLADVDHVVGALSPTPPNHP